MKNRILQFKNYNKPFVYSLFLHVFFISVLFLEFKTEISQSFFKDNSETNKPIIASSLINEEVLKKEVEKLNVQDKKKHLESLVLNNKLQKLRKENQIQQKTSLNLNKKKKQEHKQLLDLQKKKKQQLAEIQSLKAKKILLNKQVQSKQKKLTKANQALSVRKKQIKTMHAKISQVNELKKKQEAAKQAAALIKKRQKATKLMQLRQIKIKEFSDLVRVRVSRVWSLKKADPDKQSVLIVRLNKIGRVINVNLQKSSGDASIDSSAIRAVYKAGPFPIPSIMNIKEYIDLRLTLTPQGLLM